MRLSLILAASAAALMATPALAQDAGAAPAQTPAPAPAQAQAQTQASAAITDAELAGFAKAVEAMSTITASIQGAPTEAQESQMTAAISGAGLTPQRYNAIATAVANDAALQARIQLVTAAPSAAGSVGASVTDAEIEQYAAADAAVEAIKDQIIGGTPTPEQATALADAITKSGLEVERYNAITTATGADAHLRARIAVAKAG